MGYSICRIRQINMTKYVCLLDAFNACRISAEEHASRILSAVYILYRQRGRWINVTNLWLKLLGSVGEDGQSTAVYVTKLNYTVLASGREKQTDRDRAV